MTLRMQVVVTGALGQRRGVAVELDSEFGRKRHEGLLPIGLVTQHQAQLRKPFLRRGQQGPGLIHVLPVARQNTDGQHLAGFVDEHVHATANGPLVAVGRVARAPVG